MVHNEMVVICSDRIIMELSREEKMCQKSRVTFCDVEDLELDSLEQDFHKNVLELNVKTKIRSNEVCLLISIILKRVFPGHIRVRDQQPTNGHRKFGAPNHSRDRVAVHQYCGRIICGTEQVARNRFRDSQEFHAP